MKIHVTNDDILRGMATGLENPVALALKRETSQVWYVGRNYVALEMEPPFRNAPLDVSPARCVRRYFATGSMVPFEFEFKPPAEAARVR
jgi:hypothetical protein